MPQSLANVLVHLIFSTKDRYPFLRDPELRDEMHRYLSGTSENLDCPPVRVGGTEDHVHFLARLGRSISLADWIKELKRVSSLWIKTKDNSLAAFHWQLGYGAFSVSQSQSATVDQYIANQEEHHLTVSFQEEFRQFLRKHGIEFDERYVWD
jgi:REP element-mobilizing transposase RayT